MHGCGHPQYRILCFLLWIIASAKIIFQVNMWIISTPSSRARRPIIFTVTSKSEAKTGNKNLWLLSSTVRRTAGRWRGKHNCSMKDWNKLYSVSFLTQKPTRMFTTEKSRTNLLRVPWRGRQAVWTATCRTTKPHKTRQATKCSIHMKETRAAGGVKTCPLRRVPAWPIMSESPLALVRDATWMLSTREMA